MAEPFGVTAAETNPAGLGTFAFNLRMPGQVFDQESGLFYNWMRFYDSQTGRYVSFDLIGLAGGSMSPYTYADNMPTAKIDPLGLTTFMCTQPLHALGDAWGPRLYPESRFNPSPFFHQYLCVPDGKDGMTCGGQDRGDSSFGPGKPSDDTFKPESCKPAGEEKCVEQCLLPKLTDPNRPAYSLFGGGGTRAGSYNCQQWADKKMQECQQQCRAK